MTTIVGVIANPAAGKDIRRLVAHGSVFDNNEKINIVRRVLRGLDALGIEAVLAMPDLFGLVTQAYERAGVGLRLELLDMPVTNTGHDATQAARLMAASGAGCIVTLGGDGTNRVVAKGCGYVPLVAISTGTNNAFPVMIEGTLAGLAAAVTARRVPGVREAAIRMARRLEVWRAGQLVDIALVDVVAYDERFVASGAMWDPGKMRTVILSQVRPGTIGASAIAGYLPVASNGTAHRQGVWLELAAAGQPVLAPIAPGLITELHIASLRWLGVGEGAVLEAAPAVLALDGERELAIHPGEQIVVRLSQDGPHVVDVRAALRAASQAGVFVKEVIQPVYEL